jgi:hypothetical protein
MKVGVDIRWYRRSLLFAFVAAVLLGLALDASKVFAALTASGFNSPLLTPTAIPTDTPTLTPTSTPTSPPHWECPAPVVTPTSIHVPYAGGSYTIQVGVGSSCYWRTYWFTGDDWLSFYCGGGGLGSGTVNCNFGNNPQPFTRFGRIYACTSQNDLSRCGFIDITWDCCAPTLTPTPTDTSTVTGTPPTPTPTFTPTPTNTPTNTPTTTPTRTNTGTNTPSRTNTPTVTRTSTPAPTDTPVNIDAFAHLEPAGPLTVVAGQQFTLDLWVNGGSNNITTSQNYLTFTNSILQNVRVGLPGCSTGTDTLTVDNSVFEFPIQNQVCNGPAQCNFGSQVADPGTIVYTSGTFNSPPSGDFRVARAAFCATAPGDAVLHWQFSPPDPPERNTDIIDQFSVSVANRTLYTDYPVHVIAPTPTPSSALVGHITWQGRQPQPHTLQQVPVTLTLRLAAGGPDNEYTGYTTDASGFFTVPVGGLPGGNYYWRVKDTKYLANSGTVTLSGAPTTPVEMDLMKAGDANDDNVVNAGDFAVLRASFGRSTGDPGYNGRADFNGDTVVNSTDFALLKSNFGAGGAPPIGP